MAVVVRDALEQDVDALYALGLSDKDFSVSERIPFYEREELSEWIENPSDNMLCVVDAGSGQIAGFFFCKVMSYHWAVLDNFYIAPEFRDGVVGSALLNELVSRLKARKIVYLSALVERDRAALARLMRSHGFSRSKSYDWYEMFLG